MAIAGFVFFMFIQVGVDYATETWVVGWGRIRHKFAM